MKFSDLVPPSTAEHAKSFIPEDIRVVAAGRESIVYFAGEMVREVLLDLPETDPADQPVSAVASAVGQEMVRGSKVQGVSPITRSEVTAQAAPAVAEIAQPSTQNSPAFQVPPQVAQPVQTEKPESLPDGSYDPDVARRLIEEAFDGVLEESTNA